MLQCQARTASSAARAATKRSHRERTGSLLISSLGRVRFLLSEIHDADQRNGHTELRATEESANPQGQLVRLGQLLDVQRFELLGQRIRFGVQLGRAVFKVFDAFRACTAPVQRPFEREQICSQI